jgi:hypothetical protein
MKFLALTLFALMILGSWPASSYAQTAVDQAVAIEPVVDQSKASGESLSGDELAQAEQRRLEAVDQLRDIQVSLKSKVAARSDLVEKLKLANENQAEVIEAQVKEINSEIEMLEKTFEQIAIGGVDLSLFGVETGQFDWREELITVIKPLIENVKSLTEKPRKIESLRRVISDKELAKQASKEAINSISRLEQEAISEIVTQELVELNAQWRSRFEDLEREIQLAEFQLSSLEGKDVPWLEIIKNNVIGFLSGRGLTLMFVLGAIVSILILMRAILWLIRKRTSESQDRSVKVHYRLASYGYRLLTGILIAVAIMMVLYFRQDLLLLAIMVVVFIGAALALKNLLPKYVAEGKLLLNMGSVRERERVIYNGVPWEVSSINVHSRFVNPEIRGGIRIPISQMHDMISRPAVDETWFPSSEGDWVLVDGDSPHQVVDQTVDMIELRDLDSVSGFMPTADYYSAGYPNLSRAKIFRISVVFGIDYATQREDVAKIEEAFSAGIKHSFKGTSFEQHVIDVNADFESAGDSSLNYLMLATFQPEAAEHYNKIKRRIQRACVIVCSENEWSIPFPQLSVHLPEDNPKPAE